MIHGGVVNDATLNEVEMAFRSYDPCFSCATHSLPGQMPLQVIVRDAKGEIVESRSQYVAG
jgi:F420-non-reducing hydrogenase large subunit